MDIFLINILVGIICLIIGYLFGSIPTSIIIGKVFFHQDPRDYGSRNPGGTNAGRIWGKKVGLIVIILDMLKAVLPIWIAFIVLTYANFGEGTLYGTAQEYIDGTILNYPLKYPAYWLVALGCMFGNSFPLFTGFKGGKGVATYCGIAIGTCWGITIIGAIVFFVVLKIKKYVSLASISTVWTGWFLALLWNVFITTKVLPIEWFGFITYGNTLIVDWVFVLYLAIASALVTYRHHGNISRLLKGEERKITWM